MQDQAGNLYYFSSWYRLRFDQILLEYNSRDKTFTKISDPSLDFVLTYIVQVHSDIYVFKQGSIPKWTCFSNLFTGPIHKTVKPSPLMARYEPSIVNFSNEFVFVCGGYNNQVGYMDSVEKYDLADETKPWSIEVPRLKTARRRHSSCSLSDYIYVFCGENENGLLSSIERLNARKAIENS